MPKGKRPFGRSRLDLSDVLVFRLLSKRLVLELGQYRRLHYLFATRDVNDRPSLWLLPSS